MHGSERQTSGTIAKKREDGKHEISCLSHHQFKLKICILSKIENIKTLGQIVGMGKGCDQNMRDFLSHHIICLTNVLFIIKELIMRRSLVKLLRLVKSVIKMLTGCLRTTKVAIFEVKN